MSSDLPVLPWLPPELRPYYVELVEATNLQPSEVPAHVEAVCLAHEEEMDLNAVTLYAGTNVMSPAARRLLASSVGTRPSMGYPGAKYQTGVRRIEWLEVLTAGLCRRIFRAAFAEVRLQSGTLANLAVYAALTEPGDTVMVLPEGAGGHFSHHAIGAAGVRGLRLVEIPFDPNQMNVDVDGLRRLARECRPRLIVLGASLFLFPHPVREVAEIAREVGARVMYDAAHVAGLIAGRRFQAPLDEGADVMTCSTYKSFGGPPGGLILSAAAEVAEAIDRAAYPGLTANYDASRLPALAVAASEVLEFWSAYADACIANARHFALALADQGFRVVGADVGYTASHHVALDVADLGGGEIVARRLEPARILTSSIRLPWDAPGQPATGVRLGVQEVTRWGFGPAQMEQVARWMRRVLLDGEEPATVANEVAALRRDFRTVRYCFPDHS